VKPKRSPQRPRSGVLVLGEVLCDLFPPAPGVSFVDAAALVPLLGGAPANVAVQLARQGVRTGLVTAVGTDPLGARLLAELRREGVDVSRAHRRPGFRTGVTLVEVDADGERRFFPLVDRRADLALGPEDIDVRFVSSFAAVHTGTVGLRGPTARAAHRALVEAARREGLLISLDVNLRPGMYATRGDLLRRARAALSRAHVVKATREEARLLLDAPRLGAPALAERLLAAGPRLAMITLDADGALLARRGARARIAAPAVDVVDATGAGDAFVGAALATLVPLLSDEARPRPNPPQRLNPLEALDALTEGHLAAIGRAACRAGSLACTALGATTAMPRAAPPHR
jgi:fructokinase